MDNFIGYRINVSSIKDGHIISTDPSSIKDIKKLKTIMRTLQQVFPDAEITTCGVHLRLVTPDATNFYSYGGDSFLIDDRFSVNPKEEL